MPSSYSSEHSRSDAERPRRAHRPACSRPCRSRRWSTPSWPRSSSTGLAEENLQARVRGTTLMGLSNQHGHLVLATGNKSELAVGYSTLYGDAVGGFAPLKDVPKTLVWRLARWRNARRRAPGRDAADPGELDQQAAVGRAAPRPARHRLAARRTSARRRPRRLRRAGPRARASCSRPASTASWSRGCCGWSTRAEYKRRQYPPGPKISFKAFGRDRRLPITNRWREHAARPVGRPRWARGTMEAVRGLHVGSLEAPEEVHHVRDRLRPTAPGPQRRRRPTRRSGSASTTCGR